MNMVGNRNILHISCELVLPEKSIICGYVRKESEEI